METLKKEISRRSWKWNAYKVLVFTTLIIGSSVSVLSQQQASDGKCLCGRLVDQNGASIPGVLVKIEPAGTSVSSDADGIFKIESNLSELPILISAQGFRDRSLILKRDSFSTIVMEMSTVVETVSVIGNDSAGSESALSNIPGSFQLLDSKSLENSRVFNFSEALKKFSGVVVRDEEGFGLRPNIAIRGTNPTRSTKVLLLEDGVPLAYAPYGDNASYYHPPVERFEAIEVFKGSGQIEYGPVTVGGVINYLTPAPTDDRRLSIKAVGGNRDFLNGNVQLSGRDFGFGYILNFNRKQGEGARDNVRSGLSDLSMKIVRTLNSKQLLSGKFSVLDENSRVTYAGLTLAEYSENPRQNPFRNDSFVGRRYGFSTTHSAMWTSKFSSSTVFYYNRFKRDWWRQSSSSLQRPNRRISDPDCLSMSDLSTTCGNEGRLRGYRTVGIEPRLIAEFDLGSTKNELKFGFRFHSEIQDRRQLNGDTPLARSGVVVEDNLRKNNAVSGFIHHRVRIGRMAIVSGARIEDISYERVNRINQASGKTKVSQFIPGVGITFNPNDRSTLFFGIHRGFAPPRTEDIITNSGGVVELDAEKSWNYEAGLRIKPINSVSADVTWFRTNYENQIVSASVAGGVGSVFTNGGRTRHQGIEVSGRFDSAKVFSTGHNFYVTVNYTNLWDASFVGQRFSSVSGFSSVSVSGNRIPYAPRTSVNTVFGFEHGKIDILLENNSISRQFGDDLNTVDSTLDGQRGALPGQQYWNGTFNYKVERLKSTVFITVKNVFDKTFVVDRSRGMLPSSPRLIQTGIKISL